MLAGGVLLHQFVQTPNPRWLVAGLAVMLALLATFLAAGADVRWKGRAGDASQPLPRSYLIPVLSLGLALLGLGVAAFLVIE